jgi:hypothetical protein
VRHRREKDLGNDELWNADDRSIDAIPATRLRHTRASDPTKSTRGQGVSKKPLTVKDDERYSASSQGPPRRWSEEKLGPVSEPSRRDLPDPHRTAGAKNAARFSERAVGVGSTPLGRTIGDVVENEWENDVVELTVRERHGSSVTLDGCRAARFEVTEHGSAHVENRHVVPTDEVRSSSHPQPPDTEGFAAEVRLELSGGEEVPCFLLAGSTSGRGIVARRLLVPEATHVILRTGHFDTG